MAKRRRISKRDLKKPDEFLSVTSQVLLWTMENLRFILVGAVIGALVILSVVLWRVKTKNREVDALNSFYRASDILISAEDPLQRGTKRPSMNSKES